MKRSDASYPSEPDFRALWDTQTHEVQIMESDRLNRRLVAFNRGLLIRKAIAVFAAILTIKIFVFSLFVAHDGLLELGFGLLAAWVCMVAVSLWQSSVRRHKSVEPCGEYFRNLLRDERAFLAAGTMWGPLTVLPVAALLFSRIMILLPAEYHLFGWVAGAVCLVGALTKILFFRWRMHRIDAEIAELNAQA